MSGEEFVREMLAKVELAVAHLGARSSAGEIPADLSISRLLLLALKNELEATEEAALWLATETDVQVKLALARQCGDEARHYRLIEERLKALGVDTARIDPLAGGRTRLFEFLAGLRTTEERLAAGQVAREGLAQVRNKVFAEFCEAKGDRETAALYRDQINPDERHHHQAGVNLLPRFADTPEKQARARAAADTTLALAEELQEAARLKMGIARAPGC
jgi:hypothetical protein